MSLPETTVEVEYHLAILNQDGSRTRTVAFTQRGSRLDDRVRVVSEAVAAALYDPSDETKSTPRATLVLGEEDFIATAARREAEAAPTTLFVDWRTKDIRVTADIQASAARVVVQDELPIAAFALPDAAIKSSKVVLNGAAADWMAAVTPGTRSAWLQLTSDIGTAYHRVDLPPLKVVGAAVHAARDNDGPAVVLRVQNLLPGFAVRYATLCSQVEDGGTVMRPSAEQTLSRSKQTLPHLAPPSLDEDGLVELSIHLPKLGGAEEVTWLVTVQNMDGSRTRSLRIEQRGPRIEGNARTHQAALPAPVDAPVQVPDVEFVSAAQAVAQTRKSGLAPILFDMDRYEELQVAEHESRIVERQGIAAGRELPQGSQLLLGVRTTTGPPATVYREGATPISSAMPLVPATIADFVPMKTPALADAYGPTLAQPWQQQAKATLGSELIEAPDFDADSSDKDDAPSSLIRVDADPGVSLNPTSDVNDHAEQALRSVIARETQKDLQDGRTRGALGEAVAQVRDETEAKFLDGFFDGGPVDLQGPLKATAERLEVDLSLEQEREILERWSKFTEKRRHPGLMDANGNGIVSDDIVLWIESQLNQMKRYHPASHAKLTSDGMGGMALLLRHKAGSPHWLAAAKASSQTAPHLSSPKQKEQDPEEAKDAERQAPRGEPTVAQRVGPDFVRIPAELVDKSAKAAQQMLRDMGLGIDDEGRKLFANDRVVDARPAPGTWIRPDRRVALQVKRPVPDVRKSAAGEAAATLKAKEFEPIASREKVKFRKDDVVVEQLPAAGELVERDTKVELTLKRKVPSIVGRRAGDAVELLKQEDFRVGGPKDTQSSDVVASQSPEAGELADLGSEVRLNQVETIVPDLKGASLGDAKTLAQSMSELKQRNLGWEVVEPRTQYENAKVLDQSPAFGKRIDRNKEKVKVALVVPVPAVSTTAPLGAVVKDIQGRDIEVAYTSQQHRNDDHVMELKVANGTRRYLAGKTTYIRPREQVVLTVGRKVPDVAKRVWSDGLRSLSGVDLKMSLPLGEGTHVFSTEPAGGRLVDLRSPVRVIAGVEIPRLRGDSLDIARRKVAEVDLNIEAKEPREVETPNASLVGAIYVEDSPTAQAPKAGEVIRKRSIRAVRLKLIRYVEPQVDVPKVIDLAVERARDRLADRELRMNVLTIQARITGDKSLDGLQTVYAQSPNAGQRVKKNTTVDVRVTQWKHVEPAKQLVAYGIFPGSRVPEFDDAIWVATLSPDRRTGSVRVLRGARNEGRTYAVRLVDDKFQFLGKRCLTYAATGPAPFGQIRIPIDGNGFGQLNTDGVWLFAQPGGLRFQTKPLSF
ncbi:MAG: PASTA domain-containing protein [Planctomycetales bacterium]|nr:PASTA domain-containing protein [Planctomycetales bacterium]